MVCQIFLGVMLVKASVEVIDKGHTAVYGTSPLHGHIGRQYIVLVIGRQVAVFIAAVLC